MTTDELPPRTLRSARLPGVSLARALALCSALRGESLPTPTEALAGRMDASVTSSAFKQTLASARLFGLIELRRGEALLTPRGAQALTPGGPGLQARRDAVLDSGYGPILAALAGESATRRAVEHALVATGVVARSRTAVLGRALLDSARAADLVASGRFRMPERAPSQTLLEESMAPPPESQARSGPVMGTLELRLCEEDRALVHRLIAALEARTA